MGGPTVIPRERQGKGIEHAISVEQLVSLDPEMLAAEEKALVRKMDSFLLPTIWLMCKSYGTNIHACFFPFYHVAIPRK
jgi:hypothetical protein